MGNKMKTNRAAAKRFKLTGSGKIKRGKAFHGHNFTCKTPKQLRNLRKSAMLSKSDESRVKRMLGCG